MTSGFYKHCDIIVKKGIREEGFEFILKPIESDMLLRKIGEALDR